MTDDGWYMTAWEQQLIYSDNALYCNKEKVTLYKYAHIAWVVKLLWWIATFIEMHVTCNGVGVSLLRTNGS